MPNGKIDFDQDKIDRLLKAIHSGNIHLFNLDRELYNLVGAELTESVLKGFKLSPGVDLTSPDTETALKMKEGIYRFSAAKEFQFTKDVQNFIFTGDGQTRSFFEFKKLAEPFYKTSHVKWMEAEYETSLAMSERASDWDSIQKESEVFRFLRYETQGDAAVRRDHAILNGIIKPVNDDFWNNYYPPNGWNCRCAAIQLDKGTATKTKKSDLPELPSLFEGNVGKRKTAFKGDHPYFRVPKEFKEHKKQNFGLPLPADVDKMLRRLREQTKLESVPKPKFKAAKTIAEAEDFAKKQGVHVVRYNKLGLEHANTMNEALSTVPRKAVPDIIGTLQDFEVIAESKFTSGQRQRGLGVSSNRTDYKIKISEVTDAMRDKFTIREIPELGTATIRDNMHMVAINSKKFKSTLDIQKAKVKTNTFFKEQNGTDYYISTNGKTTHTHELGHVYDNRKFGRPEGFDQAARQWHRKTGIGHLKENELGFTEAWADAFADWFLEGGNNLPDNIKAIMKKEFD